MKVNQWTMSLAALGLISIPATMSAEEKMNQVWTALSSTTISGYVNTSMDWNLGTGNTSVPGYAFNSGKQDGFNLNVVKLAIEKPLDEAQWSAGYKAELIFGPDATTLATTLNSDGSASAAAIKQAYVALRAPVGNGLDFKVGVFDTIIGYESFDAGSNPNFTRSYGYTIEPTTHTGVSMSYQISKAASFTAMIANSVGPAINGRPNQNNQPAESYKTYGGNFALTAPDDWGFVAGSSLYVGVINGANLNGNPNVLGGAGYNQSIWYLGATFNTPVKNLKVGASFDYLTLTDYNTAGPTNEEEDAVALALYASLQATEKLSLHLRTEYVETDTDLLGTGPGDGTGIPNGNSKVFALTTTVQYDLWKNVLSRLELRWDHQAGDNKMVGYGSASDGEGGTVAGHKRNNVAIMANVIYKF